MEPLGDSGRSHKPAYVMLLGSHMDTAKRSSGASAVSVSVAGVTCGSVAVLNETTLTCVTGASDGETRR